MLSDEERKAMEKIDYIQDFIIENGQYNADVNDMEYFSKVLNLIEKQSKEIEELKEDRKKYAEEYIHNNPWLYKQLNENYILRVESEQKEKQAWIEGTNVADKLCNKKWEDKIKAKIEYYEKIDNPVGKRVLQSLLEKE